MKKANDIKVGSIVYIPTKQFAPMRKGWNGWLFDLGIVEKVYRGNKSGKMCASVKYVARRGGRYDLLPVTYATKNVYFDWCFDPSTTIACSKHNMKEFEDAEKAGEKVCWDNDTAFLVDNGIIDYWKKAQEV